jgi:CRISPR-associated protein Cmr2
MIWTKPGIDYWNNKLAAWWHDPIDKVFDIRGHEERSAVYLEILGLQRPNEEFWKTADCLAAGFERGQVPGYSPDPNENGAVDYMASPLLTHPTSGKEFILEIEKASLNKDRIFEELKEFLSNRKGFEGYVDSFPNLPDRYAVARFYYTHLVLRFVLAQNDVGGIGALWHRLPADSRFPDHTIWQHNALCSAFYSCMELAKHENQIGLMVFSITPVQSFISRARKLRDYWTGSVILSWLAFEGIRWIMENLGPDHILYPSLIDQPLVVGYLDQHWAVNGDLKPKMWKDHPQNIASFPNKMLFLVPFDSCSDIAEAIKKHIHKEWKRLSDAVAKETTDSIEGLVEGEKRYIGELFERQIQYFWEMQWAAMRLVERNDNSEVAELLDESKWKEQYELVENFNRIIQARKYPDESGRGTLYSVTHSLVQSALAAEKSLRTTLRIEEPGEKCQMCGEYEVVHAKKWQGENASEYTAHLREFWRLFNQAQKSEVDFKENERLCAICLIKRMAARILKDDSGHILHAVFKDAESFPSTTEMALHDYFRRRNIADEKKKRDIAKRLHESAEDRARGEKIENRDKYYAVLLMDGDNMGKLINGATTASHWETIMHPNISQRIKQPSFNSLYHDSWSGIWRKRRLVTPAIHSAISEALGDFSIYGVARIIKEYEGRLIYAGGDDVCAVLPMENAFKAADEIRKYYIGVFQAIDEKGNISSANPWAPSPGKLSVGLGIGEGISISAAILICHHKESLQQMIARAHHLLQDKAKSEAERNACAIELRKRHGGSRYFVRKWDSEDWKSFSRLGGMIGGKNGEVSNRLTHRLELMRPGIKAIMRQKERAPDIIVAFIAAQLERSDVGCDDPKEIAPAAGDIARVIIGDSGEFDPEGLIIASFIAGGNNELV